MSGFAAFVISFVVLHALEIGAIFFVAWGWPDFGSYEPEARFYAVLTQFVVTGVIAWMSLCFGEGVDG